VLSPSVWQAVGARLVEPSMMLDPFGVWVREYGPHVFLFSFGVGFGVGVEIRGRVVGGWVGTLLSPETSGCCPGWGGRWLVSWWLTC